MQAPRLLVVLVSLGAVVAVAQGFRYTEGAMPQARAGAAAVVLQNGTVLIVGGEDNGIALSSAELYNPVTETFQATGNMHTARVHPQVQMLWNSGNVLVIGGDVAGRPLTTEVYNAQTGTFVSEPSAPEALDGVVSAPVGHDRILITGVEHGCSAGSCTAPVFVYSPVANSLTPVGSLPVAVTGEAVMALGNGTVLFYGGMPANLSGSGTTNIVQIFNALTYEATLLPTSSAGVTGADAAMLPDGGVLLCGGSPPGGVPQKSCSLYDSATQTFNATGSMAVGRSGATLLDLGNGALVAGGNGTAAPDAAYYDPDTGAFTPAGSFLTERHDFTAVTLEDGTVLFAGGDDSSGKALASAELLPPPVGSIAFSLFVFTPVVTVNSGTRATFQIQGESRSGFDGSIALSCSGDRAVQCSFDPSSILPGSDSTLTVTGFAQVPDGMNRFMVTGTAGTASYSTPLDIVTQPPPGPMAVFSPPSLAFVPAIPGAASASQTLVLTNAGTSTMTVRSITAPENFSAFALNCLGELPPGDGCSIGVQFQPVKAGADDGELVIQDDAPGSPQTVTVSGTGIADPAPAVTIAPAELNFPSQPVQTFSARQTVTFASNGKGALLIQGVSLHDVQFGMQNNCPTVLPSGQKCSIQVYFFPIATGTFYSKLQIRDNAASNPVTIALSGEGVSNTPLPPVVIQPSAGGSTTAVVNAGETANYALTLVADSGFRGAVTLNCMGAPPGSRCTPTPATVVIGAKAVPLFVSVRTTAPAGAAVGGSRSAPIWPFLLVLCLPIGLVSRRRGGVVVRGAIGIAWIMLLAGCGAPYTYTAPTPATLTGNYTLTVVASSANATLGSVQLGLTVH